MIKVDGNDVFEDNRFWGKSWSADILQTTEEVRRAFEELEIVGRTVTHIRAIGLAYCLRCEWLDEWRYHYAARLTDEQRGGVEPEDWYDGAALYPRAVEIDEPVIITFDNGDRLEIDFSYDCCVRMSKNCFPPDIEHGINYNNFDANRLFSCFIGSTVTGLETEVDRAGPNILPYFVRGTDTTEAGDEFIGALSIVFADASRLRFECSVVGFGYISAVDSNERTLELPFKELKELLDNN